MAQSIYLASKHAVMRSRMGRRRRTGIKGIDEYWERYRGISQCKQYTHSHMSCI